jgi:nucleotide-binding universal stress UspA family protein
MLDIEQEVILKQQQKDATYLICVNGEEYSKVALKFACMMAKKRKAKLILLHVTEPVDYQGFGAIDNKIKAEAEKNAKKLLTNLTKEIDMDVVLLHKEGFIGEEIIKVAEENHYIDLLIVGAAAETGTKSKTLHPLVSSIGTKIMVPMVIVPGNLTDQQIELLT